MIKVQNTINTETMDNIIEKEEYEKLKKEYPIIKEISDKKEETENKIKIYCETRGTIYALNDIITEDLEKEKNEKVKERYARLYDLIGKYMESTYEYTKNIKEGIEKHYQQKVKEILKEIEYGIKRDLQEYAEKPIIYHKINKNMYENGLKIYTIQIGDRLQYMIGKETKIRTKRYTKDPRGEIIKNMPTELQTEFCCIIGAKIGRNGQITEWLLYDTNQEPIDYAHSNNGVICMGTMLEMEEQMEINEQAKEGNYTRLSNYIDQITNMLTLINDISAYPRVRIRNNPEATQKINKIFEYLINLPREETNTENEGENEEEDEEDEEDD